jgi:hypothetical protein
VLFSDQSRVEISLQCSLDLTENSYQKKSTPAIGKDGRDKTVSERSRARATPEPIETALSYRTGEAKPSDVIVLDGRDSGPKRGGERFSEVLPYVY